MKTLQNKFYEKSFFDTIAKNKIYTATPENLFKIVFAQIKKFNVKGKMLEAGCGSGVWGNRIIKHFPQLKVFGVDISEEMIKNVNKINSSRYRAWVGDLESSKLFPNKYFDSILCVAVLHHFPNISRVMENLSVWLKPEGVIILVEPDSKNIVNKLSKIMRHIIESLFGELFLLKTKMATPNEIDHSVKTYQKYLKKNNMEIKFAIHEFYQPKSDNAFSLGFVKMSLSRILRTIFPKSKFTNTTVIIVAQKQSEL